MNITFINSLDSMKYFVLLTWSYVLHPGSVLFSIITPGNDSYSLICIIEIALGTGQLHARIIPQPHERGSDKYNIGGD